MARVSLAGRVRLPSLGQLRIFDNYEESYLEFKKKNKKYYFIYITFSSVFQQNFENLTLRQLSEKKNVLLTSARGPFTALGFHELTTQFPSMDRNHSI